jgi:cardiolipin synthase A/B
VQDADQITAEAAHRLQSSCGMSSQRRKWPWIVLAVAAILIGAWLIAQDQRTLRIRTDLDAADPRFPEFVASLVGAAVARNDAYTVLQNGDEIFPEMLAAVDQARSRISFESFIYADGEVAGEFTDAFARAARRGVSVRIVVDAFGSADLGERDQETLEAAGVELLWFNPLRPWTIEETNYRTHRKILVVDGKIAFIGGVGLADHWRGDARSPEEWRDTQFRIEGPTVQALEGCFYENWVEAGGVAVPAFDSPVTASRSDTRSVTTWSGASGGSSNVKRLYLLSIAAARQSIDIQSPYFVLDESTRWALDAARARGVKVRLLTDGDRTDAGPVKDASRSAYQELLDSGYEIHEFEPTMMHVKVLVVDRHWSVIGSANFDNRSLELNDEQTLAVADRQLAATLTQAFEADLTRSRRLTAEAWRQRPLWQKARERFWATFGELF